MLKIRKGNEVMRLKRTILVWITGSLLIFAILYYAIFGNFNINNILGRYEYQYSMDEIYASAEKNGYIIEKDMFIAQTDDSWFEIKLPRKVKIKQIEVVTHSIQGQKAVQIYYKQLNDYDGSRYYETKVNNGVNVIEIEEPEYIKYLRFDMTEKKQESFGIESISIRMTKENPIQFLVFYPIFLLFYLIGSGCILNKEALLEKIGKNEKWKQKYNLIDQILALAWSDFKGRFSGSYLGILWGILQPLSNILLFWFVFQVGFRSNPVNDVPFILWLAAGMIPWNFFYDAWFGGTTTFTSYSYIVKKVMFRIEVLPLVKILSSFVLNIIFNGILIIIYCLYGRFMGLHLFDMLYYSFCLFMLTLGLSYITATLNVFMKDVGQVMGIILQILMWMTPMMWDYNMIPKSFSFFYELNPLHYVINGYRESLIQGKWFFENVGQMLWFWSVTILCLFLGNKLMKRMKDHFADVL